MSEIEKTMISNLEGYHSKSKNSLKRDDTEKYHSSIFQARLAKYKKSDLDF
jgi:hypothetical protein